jgi:FKBP-type peptidyl-prolyl cis-trans isomerase (trigger factor)
MKVEVKKVDSIKREIKFEIPKEKVSQTYEEVYKDLGKVAKIKGFRKGKVPREILEKQHASLAKEEVMKKIIPEAYQKAIMDEKIVPIDMPDIEDVNLKDGVVTFTAKFDIKPEVKIKDYKGIKVKKKSTKVTDEDINKTLEFFKQGQEKDKEAKIDDAFAKGLGYPSLEEFKTSLTRQLEMDKDRQNRFDIENQIVEELIKKAKLTVPESLVKKQLHRRVHDELKRLEQQGTPKEELDKKHESLTKDLQATVEREVKVYLILDKIGQEEKIEVKENENLPAKVMEFLFKEASWEEAK